MKAAARSLFLNKYNGGVSYGITLPFCFSLMKFSLPTLTASSRMRYFTFGYLYFMQGLPSGFALTALANYLIAQGQSSTAVGRFIFIIGIPWIIQLVWGPLIDRWRWSVVGHYKHWVVLTQWAALLASLLLFIVDAPAQQAGLLSFLFFVHALVASIQDASTDAMAINITPQAERGRVNAFMRGGLLLGISFGAAVLSIVLHRWGYRTAVGVQSAVLLVFTILFFVTRLQSSDPLWPGKSNRSNTQAQQHPPLGTLFKQLGRAITLPVSLHIFAIVAASYLLFSVFIRSVNFYLIRNLQWSDEELSVLTGGWGSLVTIAVIVISGFFADKIGHQRLQRSVLFTLALFLILFNAGLLAGLAKPVIKGSLLFWSIADPLYSIAVFPLLMALCYKNLAGSQFTAYMALINLMDIGGAYVTGWLLKWYPGPVLGLAAGVLSLLLWVLLFRFRGRLAPPASINNFEEPMPVNTATLKLQH